MERGANIISRKENLLNGGKQLQWVATEIKLQY